MLIAVLIPKATCRFHTGRIPSFWPPWDLFHLASRLREILRGNLSLAKTKESSLAFFHDIFLYLPCMNNQVRVTWPLQVDHGIAYSLFNNIDIWNI